MKGTGYIWSDMDTVRYVDAHYPHAMVDENGEWYADDYPTFGPVVGPRDSRMTVVVLSSDQSYFPGLMPAILSIRQQHPDAPLVVIDCGLTQVQVRYLQQFAEVFPSSNPLPELPAWARFDLSLLNYERVVYLDSDLIVVDTVPDLLRTDCEFAAVRNLDWRVRENFADARVLAKYGIDPDAPAFNSGVFSIDNRAWGQGRLLRYAMSIYSEIGHSLIYPDQAALQIIMNSGGHRVTFLSDGYNAIAECWDWRRRDECVRIIHYAGNEIKPWNPSCTYPKLECFFAHSKIKRT
jgi:lipopolysaccharide biosynthesis glycosyltransferase